MPTYYHFTDKETESERKWQVFLKIKELFSYLFM